MWLMLNIFVLYMMIKSFIKPKVALEFITLAQ